MGRLTSEQRKTLAEQIAARAQALRAAVASALKQPDDSDTMHLANHLTEIDDQAVADLETSLDVAALERHVEELHALDAASARMGSPDFGLCVDCAEEIPFSRLTANPAALRCTACQAAYELKQGTPRPSRI